MRVCGSFLSMCMSRDSVDSFNIHHAVKYKMLKEWPHQTYSWPIIVRRLSSCHRRTNQNTATHIHTVLLSNYGQRGTNLVLVVRRGRWAHASLSPKGSRRKGISRIAHCAKCASGCSAPLAKANSIFLAWKRRLHLCLRARSHHKAVGPHGPYPKSERRQPIQGVGGMRVVCVDQKSCE